MRRRRVGQAISDCRRCHQERARDEQAHGQPEVVGLRQAGRKRERKRGRNEEGRVERLRFRQQNGRWSVMVSETDTCLGHF